MGHSPVYAKFFHIASGPFDPAMAFEVGGSALIRGTHKSKGHAAIGEASAIDDGSLFYPGFTFSNLLSIEETNSNFTQDFVEGVVCYLQLDPSGAPAYGAYCLDSEIEVRSGNVQDFNNIDGAYLSASHRGSGTVVIGIGAETLAINNGPGQINNAIGVSGLILNLDVGHIDNATSFFALAPGNLGGGTIDNCYGLFLEDTTGIAVNNYNIYSDGAVSKNIFIGLVGIGNAAPAEALHVTLNARVDGRILSAQSSVVAANSLTLGNANQFTVSGNTQINAITTAGWTAGSHITLIFSGAPTIKHNTAGGAGTAVIFLDGSADLLAAANTILGLTYDGTSWQQTFLKAA